MGTTKEEAAARPWPGDRLVKTADFVATRAITIDAVPEQVWPWLVQIGRGRAHWYSYDRLDNAGRPSATEIIPRAAAVEARLVSRLRAIRHPWTRRMLYEVIAANGDIIMTRKMMRGIKKRAERLAARHPAPADGSPAS